MVKEELTTGRVAKMMGISVRTLRYYDQIGLLRIKAPFMHFDDTNCIQLIH